MSDPVNYRARDISAMDRELEYAVSTLESMQVAIEKVGKRVQGLSMLEIGPGSDFGAQLLLASMGCSITVADRFISRWDPAYHPLFYQRLFEMHDGPKDELKLVLQSGSYAASSIRIIEEPAEALSSVPSRSVDFVYSCAVLEHIQNIEAVAKEMYRVMKPHAAAYHQIDLRDHRNFDRPLDHLMMSDQRFLVSAEEAHYEFGNRIRSIEFWNEFEANGLRVIGRHTNDTPTQDYMSTALTSLRNAKSCYRHWPGSDLMRTSAYFLLSRMNEDEISIAKERASDARDLIEALKSFASTSPTVEVEFSTLEISLSSIAHEDGFLYVTPLPDLPPGDNMKDNYRSRLELWEDSFELSPPNCPHADIRSKGYGRFSHWQRDLYFSTSDNSSPQENGRRYVVRYPIER